MQHQTKSGVNKQHPELPNTSDEITLQDFFQEYRLWKGIFRKNIIKLFIIGFIGGTVSFIYAYIDKPVFTAKTRFMLKNEGVGSLFGGQMTGLTSLLGGGQMGTPLERTSEVIASDRIVGRALLRDININGYNDLVINHYIRLSVRDQWDKDTILSKVKFDQKNNLLEKLNLNQRKAYKIVMNFMTPEKGTGIVRKSFEKKSGVLTLTCVHENEQFAIALSSVIYDELSKFFIEQMTYNASNNANVMRRKLDSIVSELNNVRNVYASQLDQSQGLLLQIDKVDLKTLSVKEQMLNVMYAEALRNYEAYQFINQAATPTLTLIEFPYAPLRPEKKNKYIYFIFSFLIIFSSSLLYLRIAHINKTH